MKFRLLNLLIVALLLTMSAAVGFGQVSTTGSLSGSVVDPAGAVVVNATISLKNNATGTVFTAQTNDNGTFSIPSLATGDYTATVTATGFKKSEVTGVKIQVGLQSDIKISMEVGAMDVTVVVSAGNDILIQSQSAVVGTTITGRQITELPYASRNALDLVLFMPGTNTVGRPRQSTVNGLPKSMINITLDGLNIQDNVLKGSDGFFTLIQPRTDAVGEVSMSTATPGAESNAEGAVQIKFSTRSGSNDFHGSAYWEHRDKSLNSNFFWNNMLLAPKAHFGQPSSPNDAAPRTPALLNQFGGRVGGPITIPHVFNGKDRAFFFINYEEYRLPEAQLRTRTILSANAAAGIFTVGAVQTNLYTLAAANGFTSTPDPTILALINSTRAASGTITNTSDPNTQQLTFTNTGGQKRQFPTGRFDFEVNKKNHIEFIENYQIFRSVVDFLNNADPFAPGFPNHGAQNSNRFSTTVAWRATIASNLINEARFGFQNGVVLFFPENDPSQFVNQGGFAQGISTAASGISNVTTINSPQRRNTPTNQFSDNLNYTRGKHTFNFGGDLSSISTFLVSTPNGAVPSISYANDAGESTTFTNMFTVVGGATPQAQAQQLYRVLVGRLTSITHVASLGENGSSYTLDQNRIERYRQREIGMYVQDQWRFKSNLTVNFGLRYEMQYAPISQNLADTFNSFAGLFSTSGTDYSSLFKPGATGGALTSFTPLPVGQHLYNRQTGNFAPTIGFAWQPNFKSGIMKRLAGNAGQTVIRGGWSLAFDREGLNLTSSIVGANFGGTRNLQQNAGTQFARGSLFRTLPAAPANPAAPVFPLVPAVLDQASANSYDPNLKTPYVISFSGGIQRELSKDTVIEIQYVGNRGHQLLRQFNVNEVNVIENGFNSEFRLAQANLAANIAAGRCQTGVVSAGCSANFAYFGPGTGTSPLPIYVAYFQGLSAANATNPAVYTNSFFRNSSFTSRMSPSNLGSITNAGLLNNPLNGLTNNAITAGLPANFFVVNPQMAIGGSFLVNNDGKTWYDSMTIDLRRRLSHGVLFDLNYTMSRALGNEYVSSAIAFLQPATLRNTWLNKDYSPFDIRQALKGSYIAELPIGRGKAFLGNSHGIVNAILGDWALNGTVRIQSGAPLNLGNVQLVGMTRKQLEDAINIRKDPNHLVFWLPQDLIDNSRRAFNTCIPGTANCTANGYGTATLSGGIAGGDPTGRYIAPSGGNNCLSSFTGQCGFTTLIVHGPRFTRADIGIAKKWKFSESKNLEFRFEFLNAFKNTDFRLGSYTADTVAIGAAGIPTFTSAAFGQLQGSDTAYRDVSTTNDPGGRVGQIVLRFNF